MWPEQPVKSKVEEKDELDSLLDELQDATYCSYGDNYTQNEAAKLRAIDAKKAIRDLVTKANKYQTYIYKQDHPNLEAKGREIWGIRVAYQGKQVIGDIAGSKEEAEATLVKHMAELYKDSDNE